MPPKVKVTKSALIEAAISLVRDEGWDALGVRALALRAGCSTQPIFSNFESLEDLKRTVYKEIYTLYEEYTKKSMQSGEYPLYKASGMAYIAFAREEPRLFSTLFMRDGGADNDMGRNFIDDTIVPIIMKNLEIDERTANFLHLEMWAFVHGVAVMIVTSYLPLSEELVSQMLTDIYLATGKYHKENFKNEND